MSVFNRDRRRDRKRKQVAMFKGAEKPTCFFSDTDLVPDRVEYVPGGKNLQCQVVITRERQTIATH